MKKKVYVDMDGVLADFSGGVSGLDEKTRLEFDKRHDEVPNIFLNLKPMNGAIEAFEKLAGVFDVYILSTASWNNPTAWSDKLVWVKRHLGDRAHKRLILTHHKNLNLGDFLIDDRITNNGAGGFTGELIHFGSPRFPDWKSVLAYLLTKEG